MDTITIPLTSASNHQLLVQIFDSLQIVSQNQVQIMATLADLKTALDSLGTAVNTAAANIATILATISANAGNQAAIDAAVTEAQAELATLTAANASVPTS